MEQIYENKSYVMSAQTSRIIGCAITVHRALGPGYEEAFYKKALVVELVKEGMFVKQQGFPVALLINFGEVKVQTKRFANTPGHRLPQKTSEYSASHSLQHFSDSGVQKEPTCQL